MNSSLRFTELKSQERQGRLLPCLRKYNKAAAGIISPTQDSPRKTLASYQAH